MTIGEAVGDGRQTVTTAGTAVRLASQTLCVCVNIVAETDNTGIICVGGSTVVAALATRRGTPLAAGNSVSIEVRDLAAIWIDSTVDTDGVTFTFIN